MIILTPDYDSKVKICVFAIDSRKLLGFIGSIAAIASGVRHFAVGCVYSNNWNIVRKELTTTGDLSVALDKLYKVEESWNHFFFCCIPKHVWM